METINWNDFEKVEVRVGTIIKVEDFPEAQKPAYKITADFGSEIGIKKSSARITDIYKKEDLINKKIIGVVNFLPKQIGPFVSEFLCAGFYREDGSVVLAVPDKDISNGSKLG
ncbi:MAG: tRNA-binding protein [bacterium]